MGLMDEVVSFQNLLSAFDKASAGKRFGKDSLSYFRDVEFNLIGLKERLLEEKWEPGPYRSFFVNDPKRRLIQAAPFEDRIVHHAICNVIEPVFEKSFSGDSYACRVGKGTHAGMLRLKAFVRKCKRQNPGREVYALKCDVRKYFASVDHAILSSILARRIPDERLLRLLSRIISSMPGPKGIPIGNLTSQLFANVYLNELDRFAKHSLRSKFYVRYMDDFVFLSPSKAELHGFKRQVRKFLADSLALELHPRKAEIFPVRDGVDFVGYKVFGDFILLRKSGVKRFIARFKRLEKSGASSEALLESWESWYAHAKWADSHRLVERLKCGRLLGKGTEGGFRGSVLQVVRKKG
ncbi:MAG: reverse transcriptase/maturase family protein [Candidatus Micrarchaeia archaeon]